MTKTGSRKLRIAVTGANGYLGKCLCDYFERHGYEVYRLTSSKETADKQTRFTLSDGVYKDFFASERIDALVHAAYDFKQVKREDIWKINVEGSLNLFNQAVDEKIKRIVFISTMSAYEGCQSLYGQAKLEIEKGLRKLKAGISIRPGLIYSTPITDSGGMVGALVKQFQKSSVTPLIGSGKQELCLVHEQDLARLIDYYVNPESEIPPQGYIIAANPRFYRFRDILKGIAKAVGSEKVKFIPIPWQGIWVGIKMAETVGVGTGFRSDSVLSLVHQNKKPDFSVPLPENVSFRDFSQINENPTQSSARSSKAV